MSETARRGFQPDFRRSFGCTDAFSHFPGTFRNTFTVAGGVFLAISAPKLQISRQTHRGIKEKIRPCNPRETLTASDVTHLSIWLRKITATLLQRAQTHTTVNCQKRTKFKNTRRKAPLRHRFTERAWPPPWPHHGTTATGRTHPFAIDSPRPRKYSVMLLIPTVVHNKSRDTPFC